MFSLRKHNNTRFLGVLFLFLAFFVTVCLYYGTYSSIVSMQNPTTGFGSQLTIQPPKGLELRARLPAGFDEDIKTESNSEISSDTCLRIRETPANINTVEEFPKSEFQPFWLKSREYWDEGFEDRYKIRRKQWPKFPLKVIIVPHSHNDPGWLKTFEGYYHSQTRNILNHMVEKLPILENMTFIWSEISFLSRWWESAHVTKKRVVQQMLEEGRLEIVTGGWVMTDEATSHIYGMLDQLIEGHQWIKNNLGINVNNGWSVDPFGHGSTVPYLLRSAGLNGGTVIQRIHYAWKHWFAEHMKSDFLWRQNWDSEGRTDMLVHNQPFDIYSIKHSCGPHPQICTYYDFRKIPGEFTEYSIRAVPIDEQNVKQKADTLMEQYGRTGSLSPHNVILVPLGDDFRYDQDIEWEQQYRNYKFLLDYINGHKEVYNAEVVFGTPNDYFLEIEHRSDQFPTLKGDFFVYSDIFSEGRPAYWSGYYTTRPYWKLLDRELARNLRSAEILYTFGLNTAKQRAYDSVIKVLERNYEKLVRARRNLALFQHHDAITGTSKAYVMRDYALKLIEGIQDSMFLQTFVVQNLLLANSLPASPSYRVINTESDFDSYDTISPKVLLTINRRRKVVIFNSMAQHRQEVIKVYVNTPYLRITDHIGNVIVHQINPVWNLTFNARASVSTPLQSPHQKPIQFLQNRYELLFIAELAALSLNVFTISADEHYSTSSIATIYCLHCRHDEQVFQTKPIPLGDIQLENRKIRALFEGRTGLLKSITNKNTAKQTFCEMNIAAYQSAQFHSGAYLFMPEPNARETEHEILLDSNNQFMIITSGAIASELTVINGDMLTHSSRLYHTDGPLAEGMYMENIVDFGIPPKNRETEMFIRFSSAINNGDPPVFYTDSNGVQMQKRVTVARIGIEGNYYPVTTTAYIEDDEHRLTLLVDHSQGAASWQPGWLEVMVDRRTLYDDARGMGEGLVDNKKILTKYWLLLEEVSGRRSKSEVSRSSLIANYLSNSLLYPSNLYIVEEHFSSDPNNVRIYESVSEPLYLISRPLPCDVHLMNLRTSTDQTYTQFPSSSALMVLHRQGFACDVSSRVVIPHCSLRPLKSNNAVFGEGTRFAGLRIKSLIQTSLTGVHQQRQFSSLEQVELQPMELLTLNLTFSSS